VSGEDALQRAGVSLDLDASYKGQSTLNLKKLLAAAALFVHGSSTSKAHKSVCNDSGFRII